MMAYNDHSSPTQGPRVGVGGGGGTPILGQYWQLVKTSTFSTCAARKDSPFPKKKKKKKNMPLSYLSTPPGGGGACFCKYVKVL